MIESHNQADATVRVSTWQAGLLTAVAAGLLFVVAVWVGPLQDPDETRCALIVQSILQRGHWIVPELEGEPYIEKPAPFFWLAAVGQRLSGDVEAGGRIVAALAALTAVLVAFDFGRCSRGAVGGMLAGLVLATGAMFFFLARWYRMDMPFAAAAWAAVWWFVRGGFPSAPKRPRWTCSVGFYLLAGFATLMKGPAGVALPVAIISVYLLWDRRPRRLLELLDPRGLAVWAIVVMPYYMAAELHYPGFLHHFLIGENVQRFTGTGHEHHWNGLVYLPILLAAIWPWTIFLPGAIIDSWRRRRHGSASRRRMNRLLWSAVLVPLVLFSLSGTKLAHYILPCVPPLAVLIALPLTDWLRRPIGKIDRLYRAGAWCMAAGLMLSLLGLGITRNWLVGLDWWTILWLVPPIGFLVAACIALAAKRRARAMVILVLATMVILLPAACRMLPAIFNQRSHRDFARQAAAISPDVQLCYFTRRRFSFPLYAGALSATRFENDDPQALEQLAGLLDSPRALACLVDSKGDVVKLITISRRELYLAGPDPGGFWLVANRPGVSLQLAGRGL